MASGVRPTDAAMEAGCTLAVARYAHRGALERGCYEVPPTFPALTPSDLGHLKAAAQRRNAALREDVRASADRCLALAREARALSESLRAAG